MHDPGENANRATLPLFRPEALAARHSLQGEILLIRPFSLVFLCCLAIFVVASLLSFLVLGHYTPTGRIYGAVLAPDARRPATSPNGATRAVFYVPEQWTTFIQPGKRLILRCPNCNDSAPMSGAITDASQVELESANAAPSLATADRSHRILVALAAPVPRSMRDDVLTSGARLEAELPLERKPLIHWLLKASKQ